MLPQVSDLWEGVLSASSSEVVGRVRLRRWDVRLTLDETLTLQTNVTRYPLPLAVYSGHLEVVCYFLAPSSACARNDHCQNDLHV